MFGTEPERRKYFTAWDPDNRIQVAPGRKLQAVSQTCSTSKGHRSGAATAGEPLTWKRASMEASGAEPN